MKKADHGSGDPSGMPVSHIEPVAVESPPPARPDPVAVIRNRLTELLEIRKARIVELEQRVKAELAPLDASIAELNSLLEHLGQTAFTQTVEPPAFNIAPIQSSTGMPNIRQMAQASPLSGANMLRKKMGRRE